MKYPRANSKKTLRSDATALIEDCAGLASRMTARRVTQFLEHEISASGLSLAQLGLMAHVAATTDDTIGALADRAGLDQSTLSRNLRALQTAGLAEIRIVDADLRRRAVWLTEQGAIRLERAIPLWRRATEKLGEHISLDAARRLARQTCKLPVD